jgi:hypothetical protein
MRLARGATERSHGVRSSRQVASTTESEDDEADADRDEGILNVSELDGFLTAIVSGPTTRGKTHLVVDEWCYGYTRAIALDVDAWDQADPEIRELLAPIRLFGTEAGWEASEKMNDVDTTRQRDAIPDAARQVYRFWLSRRAPAAAPLRRESPKVGRNEPCPCGSGKKFKHCCLK